MRCVSTAHDTPRRMGGTRRADLRGVVADIPDGGGGRRRRISIAASRWSCFRRPVRGRTQSCTCNRLHNAGTTGSAWQAARGTRLRQLVVTLTLQSARTGSSPAGARGDGGDRARSAGHARRKAEAGGARDRRPFYNPTGAGSRSLTAACPTRYRAAGRTSRRVSQPKEVRVIEDGSM